MTLSSAQNLGAVFIGCIATSIFYGITSVQTFLYFTTYRSDSARRRLPVGLLWLLETVHTALVIYITFHYTITEPTTMFQPDSASSAIIVISNFNCLMIRLTFAHRIWRLTNKRWWIAGPICFVTLVSAGLGMSYGIRTAFRSFFEFTGLSWQLYATLGSALLADFMITVALSMTFLRLRSGIKSTDSALTTLMMYTINSGLLTSLTAGATLVTYALLPHDYVFMSVFFVIGASSFNALLAMLNARDHLREQMHSAKAFHVNLLSMPTDGSVPSFWVRERSSGQSHSVAMSMQRISQVGLTV